MLDAIAEVNVVGNLAVRRSGAFLGVLLSCWLIGCGSSEDSEPEPLDASGSWVLELTPVGDAGCDIPGDAGFIVREYQGSFTVDDGTLQGRSASGSCTPDRCWLTTSLDMGSYLLSFELTLDSAGSISGTGEFLRSDTLVPAACPASGCPEQACSQSGDRQQFTVVGTHRG